ncbi:hypothetical protein B0F90DRAFT_1809563 [Multifurca ochricompacta]|uniref:Polysaccharide lyase 14 domain-containing protein n=1 Tax=Multifurca ochricompacta TaxID=376703 RepID=A0AAD4QN93_9AGAM|nr:hypothetical protein B0F90DRAFT_1809563 [Multifurca ochricompacta]
MRLISWCSLSLPYLRVLHACHTRTLPLGHLCSVKQGTSPHYSSLQPTQAPKFFDDLSPFNITHFASGRRNLEIVVGIIYDLEGVTYVGDPSPWASWTDASTMLQLFYPKDSINPAQRPQGGSEFYAAPLDLRNAHNVTLVYSILFPSDFEWVKGGKLPGLYGGHTRCSGGDDAFECFSTRLMWRADGDGELYLYAPKDRQTASLCNAPPLSICDTTFGLSIARGSFQFARGSWTHLRQTVVLNTPGVQDGGFLLEVDGNPVIDRADVLYRDAREYPAPEDPDYPPTPSQPSQPEDGGGTFFGGHDEEFATPKDQFVWFKDFAIYINS